MCVYLPMVLKVCGHKLTFGVALNLYMCDGAVISLLQQS